MGIDYKKRPGMKREIIGEIQSKYKVEISIITPFYNGGKTLEETANSVFSQTYPFFEWIIVDDGSKDQESLEKLDKISKKYDKIRVFHKENGGPSTARDFGISKANKSSKYIFFLDCDDIMDKTMIECLYWALETHKDASFAYTSMVNFGDREFLWERYLTVEQQKVENLICISSMIRKEDLLEVGCFGIKEKAMFEDWNLWLKLLAKGKKPIRVNAPIFWYRISGTGEFSRAKENPKAMNLINSTARIIEEDVEVIQFPRTGERFPIVAELKDMVLPKYKKDNKKTILFILPWATIGGADIFNLELIKRLSKDKFNIIIITTLPNENPLRQEFSQVAKEFYDLSTFLDRKDYYNFVSYIISSRNVNTIFTSNSDYAYAMMPLIKCNHPDISIIDYIHSVDLNDKRGSFGRYTYDFDSCIDATYTCNDYTTNQLKNDFNKPNVETIYIGTDHKKFDPNKYNKKELLEKYKIPENKKVITFVARFSDEKRPVMFVDIAKKLLEDRKDLYFIMVGDGKLYNDVKSKINHLHLSDYFKKTGMLSDSVGEIYAISDLTINCSTLEGLALTSYESLSMGVPVVSSNVGGQKELIDDSVGRIVNINEGDGYKSEVNRYAQATLEVLNDLKKLKDNARKRIVSGFTLEKMAEKFEKVFLSLKSKEIDQNSPMATLMYELHLEKLFDEYAWFCKEYCERNYGVFLYDKSEETPGRKQAIIKKFKKIAIRYNIKNEMLVIFNLIKISYHMLLNIKEVFKNIVFVIIYFFKSIYVGIKLLYRFMRKIIRKN